MLIGNKQWLPSQLYQLWDIAYELDVPYKCIAEHTSDGIAFITDYTLGYRVNLTPVVNVEPISSTPNTLADNWFTERLLLVDCQISNIDITVPAPSVMGWKTLTFKKTDSTTNTFTVIANSVETFDWQTTITAWKQYDVISIISDYTNWYILEKPLLNDSSTVRVVTATWSVSITDYTLRVDASAWSVVLTLPSTAWLDWKIYDIKKIDSSANTVTIDVFSWGQTIDWQFSQIISTQRTAITIQAYWVEWGIM